MKTSTYQTSDFNLAISLLTFNQQLVELNRSNPKRIEFCFKDTVELHQLIDLYWSRKLSVLPQDFYNAQKELKNRMYQGK